VIPIDSIFSPIRKTNFRVEDMRQDMVDYDRLFLEVWTDGTITAKDAIAEAARLLTDHLDMFIDFDETYVEPEEEVDEEMEMRKAYLLKPVAELELSVRSANCLEAADIINIKDLVTRSEPEMLKFRNFGRKSLNEIKTILTEMGLSLGMLLDGDEPVRVAEAEESTDAS
jgi:DNA-directed RNA polymerase subunit alpha